MARVTPLAEALLKHPNFARDAHLTLAASLGTNYYSAAARLFFDAAKRNPKFAWSGPLMDMLATLPAEEVRPLFRRQWANLALRDELVLKLCELMCSSLQTQLEEKAAHFPARRLNSKSRTLSPDPFPRHRST